MMKRREGAARKIFLSSDLIGQRFLCFLVAKNLIVVRYEIFQEESTLNLTFGAATVIENILDATPCISLGMVMTMDKCHKLSLYSGGSKVCGVHFIYSPSVQMAHIAQEIATLQIDSNHQNNVVTSSRPPSAVDAKFFHDSSLVLLSPVQAAAAAETTKSPEESPPKSAAAASHQTTTVFVTELHSVVNETALLKYGNGVYVRLALPKMHTSSLISRCFSALRSCIQGKEACLSLLSEWYCVRNCPGPSSISNAQEWDMFAKCLMGLIGYNTGGMNFSTEGFAASRDSSMASPCSSKKMKHSEDGCDGDWHKLLSSKRHHESGKQLSFVLGIDDIDADLANDDKCLGQGQVVDTSRPLFSNVVNILHALHLLYEDSKLNKFCWKGLPLLASFLSRISADLNLNQFVHHYWKDFPTVCHINMDKARTNQFSQYVMSKLGSQEMETSPPSIFQCLQEILAKKTLTKPFSYIKNVTDRTHDIVLVLALFASKGGLVEPINYCIQV
jgi:anaphase-promoting complex subunit 1